VSKLLTDFCQNHFLISTLKSQGQIKGHASSTAAQDASLFGALRHHSDNQK